MSAHALPLALALALASCASAVQPVPTARREAAEVSSNVRRCAGSDARGWTPASGDVSRAPVPMFVDGWFTASPSASDVTLRLVRRAHCDGCELELAWVALVPETCAAFAAVDAVWWPIAEYGPPIDATAACERTAAALERHQRTFDELASLLHRGCIRTSRCPLVFVPGGASLGPRATALVARWRGEPFFGWWWLHGPLRAATSAYAGGDDRWAEYMLDAIQAANEGVEPSFSEGPASARSLFEAVVRSLRKELHTRRSAQPPVSSVVAALRDLAAVPDDHGNTPSHRLDPRFIAVLRDGERAIPDLRQCIADEASLSRYVVTDFRGQWRVVKHADLCALAMEEILHGATPTPAWETAHEYREATRPRARRPAWPPRRP